MPSLITTIMAAVVVFFIRLYRLLDDLLTGGPVWEQAAARRQAKDKVERRATHSLNGTHVVTE
ncbi:hypothetical protein ACFUIY_13270 [Streptomyces griseorubiginosus]|uniref:hypothetical protein n=1 Tax=Streptomyces griseorubiginosus TaxID=67304 RepID=UPI003642D03A